MKPGYFFKATLVAFFCFGLTMTAFGASLKTQKSSPKPLATADPDGDGRVGEETAIRERISAYLEYHGIDGKLDSKARLRRALYARKMSRQQSSKTIQDGSWVNIGPINGAGRASCVAPHPTRTGVILEGAASGGVWKTLDGGTTWYPTMDDLSDLAIGALAWAPSSPDVVYAGSGEGDILRAGGTGYIPGIGILRSDDGGDHWVLPGQESDPVADLFFALNVDPQNADIVFAATEQGLLRSEDGGANWQSLMSSSSSASFAFTEIQRSASNPDLMYAAQWCYRSCPAGTASVMRSDDRGLTWLPAGAETLPPLTGYSGRMALALSPSNDQILYLAAYNTAGSSTEDPIAGIYRSDDGGQTWVETALSSTIRPKSYLGSQGWYDNTIVVNPTDPNIVVAGGIWYVLSTDGGETWTNKNPYQTPSLPLPHVDAHDLQYQGQTLWVGCDGGVWSSTDNGVTWTDRNDGVVTRQYYGMAVDPINRARVLGGAQDNGTNLRRDDDDNTFDTVLGGDGFECAINPMMPDMMYGSIYYTSIYRTTPPSLSFRDISPYYGDEDAPFITPLALNPKHPNIVFTGAENVYRSDNGGDSWYKLPVDPHDVTNGLWSLGKIWAIATTTADVNRIAVSKGSLVYNSSDGGQTWTMGVVGTTAINLDISPFDPDLVIAAISAGISRSTDGGSTWTPISEGLPPFNTQVVRFDPTDADIVYAGTDVGLYRSTDAGLTWQPWGDGLPSAPVDDLRILEDGSMLRVGTYGRGFWELTIPRPDNTTPEITITSPSVSSMFAMIGDSLDLQATATDADGDALQIDWYSSLNYSTIASDNGSAPLSSSHRITIDRGGSYRINARVTDARGLQAIQGFSVFVRDAADDCASPHVIPSGGPFPYEIETSNEFAGLQTSDPQLPCVDLDSSSPDAGRQASLWFEFTPQKSGIYSVSTCGSVADTMLSGWTGDACGSYTEIAGACNDDDEQEHCMGPRTDSYLELALDAGETYRFMVGSWAAPDGTTQKGQVHFNVDCLDCEEEELQTTMVPAGAHTNGLSNTFWLTDLQLYNPGSEEVSAELGFLPPETDNSGVEVQEVSIQPGHSTELSDVVGDFLGESGSGAIRIVHSAPLLVTSRTYNTSESGTFGQFVPGSSSVDQTLQPGDSVSLIGLAGNSDFRTNIGCANTSGNAASFNIKLFNASGTLLWDENRDLLPWGWLQIDKVFQKLGLSNITAGSALISNTGTEAPILPYASIIDNNTGDPTYISDTLPAQVNDPVWIGASAHANGVGTSVWRTDLEFMNPGSEDISVSIDLMMRGQDNSSPEERTLNVAAGESTRVEDVLNSLFNLTDGAAALRISVDTGQLLVTSRTYNQADTGTFGQFIPGLPESRATGQAEDMVLMSLRQNENFRTNIGFVNTTGNGIEVQAILFDASGAEISTITQEVAPFSYIQSPLELPAGVVLDGGFARISTTTDGAFFGFASVIDRGSDDPIFIPAVPIPS